MALSTGKAYLEHFADDPIGQRALLACAAALQLNDESAAKAMEIIAQANGRTRELLHEVKTLGCVWKQWDGSWYIAEEVRKDLADELYRQVPEEQISKLRLQLAEMADKRAAGMPADGQITAHRQRLALLEAGMQRALVPEESAKGGEQLGAIWEQSPLAAGQATARSVDYLASEIEKRSGRLPVQVLFLRGMAARGRGDRSAQQKYFRAVWEQGNLGRISAIAAHLFGNLVRDGATAERALNDSLDWNEVPSHQAHVWHSLGNLLAKDRDRWGEAEAAYRESIKLDPLESGKGQVWHSLGNLLAKGRNRWGEAEAAYRRGLELFRDPAHQAQVWHSLGNLLTKESRWQDAEDAYKTSIELWYTPEQEAHVGASLANLLSKYNTLEANERAERLALRSLKLDRGNPWTNGICYRVLADVYERRGDYLGAIRALEALMRTNRQLGEKGFEQQIRDRISRLRRFSS